MNGPDDLELRKLALAGASQAELAERYGVTQQAISKRLVALGIVRRGTATPVLRSMPWDLAGHPDKRRILNGRPFNGLRYFVAKRLGDELSERAEADRQTFIRKVNNGLVLTLDEAKGFVYVPRTETDGDLVIRWPEGRDDSLKILFRLHLADEGADQQGRDA